MPPSHPADPAPAPGPSLLSASLLRNWPLPLDPEDDKHSRGTVMVIGGSPRTPGAVLLAGVAALRMGAGRLQLATAEPVATALAVAVPEALVEPVGVTAAGALVAPDALERLASRLGQASAVLVGPGLEQDGGAIAELVEGVLAQVSAETVVVLDARAIGAVAGVCRPRVPGGADRLVITPNPGELAGLGGDGPLESTAVAVSRRHGVVVATKGLVVAPDGRRWRESGGGPGLGTSGSGAVLAGLVAGAAARSGDPAQAACWATHAHARAGDRLAARLGAVSFLARELLDEVPAIVAACTPP
jgi:ADP-dependent NAD(P)H-hydrate dehydratase